MICTEAEATVRVLRVVHDIHTCTCTYVHTYIHTLHDIHTYIHIHTLHIT